MFDNWIGAFISDIWIQVISFIIIISVSHLIFIYILNWSKKRWKQFDYLWLFTALLGIVFLFAEQRINIAKVEKESESSRTSFLLDEIINSTLPVVGGEYCLKFIKNEDSPDDFDHRVEQHNLECKWMENVNFYLIKQKVTSWENFPDISFEDLPPINFTPSYYFYKIEDLKRSISEYNKQKNKYLKIKHISEKQDYEKILSFLAPFLLLIALALRITKVTAELRFEKQEIG